MKPDLTYRAVKKQLEAMSGGRPAKFEIGIKKPDGKWQNRVLTKTEVLNYLPFLKRENALGRDIYICHAPGEVGAESAGLVLVDDLKQGQIARMKADGIEPACIVQSSPLNFQAWVRLSDAPLAAPVASAAAKLLQERYGGDPGSVGWKHPGRLSGFTNRKPVRGDELGRSLYVLLDSATGKTATAAAQVLAEARQLVLDKDAANERKARLEAAQQAPANAPGRDPVKVYRSGLKRLRSLFGPDMDLSKADFMLATELARAGYKPAHIEKCLNEASPELPTRKAGHEADYVQRTVRAAMQQATADMQPENRAAAEAVEAPPPGMSL